MRILLTGASGGIGRATAQRLAAPGSEFVLHFHRHRPAAEGLARELAGSGCPAHLAGADLADGASVERLAREVADRWPSLDVLIHNAGDYPRKPFEEIDDDDWRRCLATNLDGPARLTRALLPQLRAGHAPSVVFVSSVLAFTGSSHGAHYAAAKAGVLGLVRSLARELAPTIRVNVVAPGAIDTVILAGDTPARRAARIATIPLDRIGTAQDVANAIAFLAGPESSYVTGTTLHVNGGLRLD